MVKNMSKSIDKKTVKFRGEKVEIKNMLNNGDDLEISMKGSIISETAQDNQDGSVNMVYQFKPIIIEIENCELDTEIEEVVPIKNVPFPGL